MTSHPDLGHTLPLHLGEGLWQELLAESQRRGESPAHLARRLLSEALDLEHHTVYQVSTSGALVQGVYQGCVRVGDLLRHGDFGLGTFAGLDGEGILLDGTCWQARSDGSVREAPADAEAPFWVTTHFRADRQDTFADVQSWEDLTSRLDRLRDNNNLFVGLRLEGQFERIHYRVACRAEAGTDLVSATSHQAEFQLENVRGTLVGFWTPSYARTINVPGYHLHLLSDDHQHGGHVLDLHCRELKVALHREDELHLALPETPDFLKADLSGDPAAALAVAESKHS